MHLFSLVFNPKIAFLAWMTNLVTPEEATVAIKFTSCSKLSHCSHAVSTAFRTHTADTQ